MRIIIKILLILLVMNFNKIQAQEQLLSNKKALSEKMYFCTAADEYFYQWLLSLIGSIHKTNFNDTEEIAVFDLGFSEQQRIELNKIQKVRVYSVEKTNPDLLKRFKTNPQGKQVCGWYAWKPVVIKQALEKFPYVLYIDAGSAILKPLQDLFKYIQEHGYFLIRDQEWFLDNRSILFKIGDNCTQHVKNTFVLGAPGRSSVLEQPGIIAGVQGHSKALYNSYILPIYELTKNLKNFEDDGSCPLGFGWARHDQVIFSIYARLLKLDLIEPGKEQTLQVDGKNFTICAGDFYPHQPHIFYNCKGQVDFSSEIKFKSTSENIQEQPKVEVTPEVIEEKEIIVLVPSYNNKDWYKKNLDSIFEQKYSKYKILYIDDASPDGTGKLVEQYIKDKKQEERVMLVKNKERRKALANIYYAIHACDDHKIVIILDGDDWFCRNDALTLINKAYADQHVWFVYAQFEYYPSTEKGFQCSEFPREVIEKNAFRDCYLCVGHPRTFYAWLFKKIKLEDLLFGGKFFPMSYDQAITYPMLEMAGDRIKFVPDVLYTYNRSTALNDDKVNGDLQWECTSYIREKMECYKRL